MSKKDEKKVQAENQQDNIEENTDAQVKQEEQPDELSEISAELDSTKDMLLRTVAEFDNYKKRTEKEREKLSEFIKANTVKELLPVADNIARAALCDKGSADYIKGLEMIVKQMCEALDKIGLKEIEAAGQQFDPTLHEAVMHIEDSELPENTVAEVLQAGYKLGDTVIRPSMVKVAN